MKKSIILKALGKKIRTMRVAQGLSQEKLAKLVDLHPTYLSQIENGKRNLTVLALASICKGLNVRMLDIWLELGKEGAI